jgi:hypothetical protein
MLKQSIWFSSSASKQLRSLEPVFEELRSLHERYIKSPLWVGDCAYWYGERPDIGLLAAAVWRQHGGTALEEYAAKKPKGRGRADLYFSLGKVSYGCEVKRRNLNLNRVKSAEASAKNISKTLKKEYGDAKKRQKTDCKVKKVLGLCFITTTIDRTKLASLDERLSCRMKMLKRDPNCAAVVWIGFRKGEESPHNETTYSPGFFLAIREK